MFSPTHIYFFDYTRKYGQRKHVFWHVLRIAKPGGKMCWRNEALEYWNLLKVNLSHRVRYLGTQCIVYAKKSLSKRSYKKKIENSTYWLTKWKSNLKSAISTSVQACLKIFPANFDYLILAVSPFYPKKVSKLKTK